MIYDNVSQTVLSFDILELYKRYITFNIDHIDTIYGKFHLTKKTIDDIIEMSKRHYQVV